MSLLLAELRWAWRERRRVFQTPCADCGINVTPYPPYPPRGSRDWHRYMVTDEVWGIAGMEEFGGWLHIGCLEARLPRPLTGADFLRVPLNEPFIDPDPPRLAELKRDYWIRAHELETELW